MMIFLSFLNPMLILFLKTIKEWLKALNKYLYYLSTMKITSVALLSLAMSAATVMAAVIEPQAG